MNIKVEEPVLYLWHTMNVECLSYADYPKSYHFWAENEEHALKQLLNTLKELDEVDEFGDYTIERVWANGIEGGAVIK